MSSSVPLFQAHAPDPPDPPDNAVQAQTFEEFFERHLQEIVGYVWRMTADEQVAYDLSQEVFLRAWRHFAEISAYDHPRAWLFRVATNLALNHLRQRARWGRASHLSDGDMPPDRSGATLPAESLADSGAIGADPTAAVAERDAIRAALLALEPWYRATLILHAVYGLTIAEIAEALDITASAAKTRLARSRKRFRARYLSDAADHAPDDMVVHSRDIAQRHSPRHDPNQVYKED